MKALRTKVCTYAVAILTSLGLSTTPLLAGSSDFSGVFIAGHASVNGIGIDGSHTGGDGELTRGTAGGFVPVAGLEAGFNLPLGDTFFIGLGGTMINGSAELASGDDFDNNADVTIEVSDAVTYWVQPSISVFDNSAVYVKIGTTTADLKAIGSGTIGSPGNLSATTYGIGMQTMTPAGFFIKTEAGATQFDQFRITGIGNGGVGGGSDAGNAGTATVEGNPLLAHGSVSIGYKF